MKLDLSMLLTLESRVVWSTVYKVRKTLNNQVMNVCFYLKKPVSVKSWFLATHLCIFRFEGGVSWFGFLTIERHRIFPNILFSTLSSSSGYVGSSYLGIKHLLYCFLWLMLGNLSEGVLFCLWSRLLQVFGRQRTLEEMSLNPGIAGSIQG